MHQINFVKANHTKLHDSASGQLTNWMCRKRDDSTEQRINDNVAQRKYS